MTSIKKTILIPLEKYNQLLSQHHEVHENNTTIKKTHPQIQYETEEIQSGLGSEDRKKPKWLLGIPVLFKRNVQAILEHLEDHKDTLSWNDRGEIIYKSQIIPGSNLTDLLKDSQRHYKSLDPYGDREFYRAWAELNIPEGLLANENRKREVRQYKSHALDKYIPPPPGIPQKALVQKRSHQKQKWLKL